MTFPLWYILIPYAVVLLGTGIFTFFNLYHVAVFGLQRLSTFLLLALYTFSYIAVVLVSLSVLSQYSWQTEVGVGDVFPFANDMTERTL